MNDVFYRLLRLEETAAVSALAREVFDQCVAPHYAPEGVREFHRFAAVDALATRHAAGHVTLVAVRNGEIVGMLHLRSPCHVAMLFVRPDFQRRGIGRELLASVEALQSGSKPPLTVNSSPNAVSAYERLGFRTLGTEQCVRGIRFIPMERSAYPIRKP